MTSEQKSYLISQLSFLLDQMVDTPEEQKAVKDGPREMLTLQECTEVIKGVSAHAIRVLIAKGEIQALRKKIRKTDIYLFIFLIAFQKNNICFLSPVNIFCLKMSTCFICL